MSLREQELSELRDLLGMIRRNAPLDQGAQRPEAFGAHAAGAGRAALLRRACAAAVLAGAAVPAWLVEYAAERCSALSGEEGGKESGDGGAEIQAIWDLACALALGYPQPDGRKPEQPGSRGTAWNAGLARQAEDTLLGMLRNALTRLSPPQALPGPVWDGLHHCPDCAQVQRDAGRGWAGEDPGPVFQSLPAIPGMSKPCGVCGEGLADLWPGNMHAALGSLEAALEAGEVGPYPYAALPLAQLAGHARKCGGLVRHRAIRALEEARAQLAGRA